MISRPISCVIVNSTVLRPLPLTKDYEPINSDGSNVSIQTYLPTVVVFVNFVFRVDNRPTYKQIMMLI